MPRYCENLLRAHEENVFLAQYVWPKVWELWQRVVGPRGAGDRRCPQMTTASGMWPSHPHHMRSPFWKPPVVGGVVWVRVGVGGTAAGAGGSVVLGGNMAGERQEREEQERERGRDRGTETQREMWGSGEERNWDYGREGRRLWGRECRRGRWSPGGVREGESQCLHLMFCLPLLLCHCPPFLFYETFLTHSLPSAKAFFLFRLESYPRFYF